MRIKSIAAAVVVGALGALVIGPQPASARRDGDPALVRVSAVNPQPQCSVGADSDPAFPATRDWDTETTAAVSPLDPTHVVAAWMSGYADSITAARSTDGGGSWQVGAVPILDCAHTHSTLDQWLTIGTDVGGRTDVTYLSVIAVSAGTGVTSPVNLLGPTTGTSAPVDSGIVVLRSPDDGKTWGPPQQLDHATDVEGIDGSQVVTDPGSPGTTYALWSKVNTLTFLRTTWLRATHDGGRSWGPPVALPATSAGTVAVGTRLAVGAAGALVAVSPVVPQEQYDYITGQSPRTFGPTDVDVTTSYDGGLTWSPQTTIARADANRFAAVSVAADTKGQVVAAWIQLTSTGLQPTVATSPDSGRTWTAASAAGPVIVSEPFLAINDIVAAPTTFLRDGRPGLLFYDHRGDDPTGRAAGEPPHTTNVWSRQLGLGVWTEAHVAGPFDGTTGPADDSSVCTTSDCVPSHSFLGDYWGVVTLPRGNVAVSLTLPNPTADSPHNTDVFFTRLP